MCNNKGLSRNKPGRLLRGFFALDKALKRSHTGGISSFDNEVWCEKDRNK